MHVPYDINAFNWRTIHKKQQKKVIQAELMVLFSVVLPTHRYTAEVHMILTGTAQPAFTHNYTILRLGSKLRQLTTSHRQH